MTKIDGVNYGYTKNGNPYKKSSTGKNVGTAVGAACILGVQFVPYQTMANVASKISKHAGEYFAKVATDAADEGAKCGFDYAKKLINISEYKLKSPEKIIFKLLKNPPKESITKKFADKLIQSKNARIGLVAAITVAGVALYAGIGRLLGHGVDKIIDKSAKAEADRKATQEA